MFLKDRKAPILAILLLVSLHILTLPVVYDLGFQNAQDKSPSVHQNWIAAPTTTSQFLPASILDANPIITQANSSFDGYNVLVLGR